jgi:hypothetical protein
MTQKNHDTGDNKEKQQGTGHIGKKVLEEDTQSAGGRPYRKIDPTLSGEKGDGENARDVPPGAAVHQPDNAPAGGMKASGSGAVKGGGAAKPDQMQGDEDESAKGP